jgi:TonB family protein
MKLSENAGRFVAKFISFTGALIMICWASVSASNILVPDRAEPVYAPKPVYPDAALKRHAEGKGIFILRVGVHTGRVKLVYIVQSTGVADLDNAAAAALKRWRFKPNSLRSIRQIYPETTDLFAGEDALATVPIVFQTKDTANLKML